MARDATVLYDDPVVRSGAWSGVIFEIWLGSASPSHFRDLARCHYEYVLGLPDRKAAMFAVVQMSNFGTFGGEARKELEARSKKLEGHTRASVVVLPSQGFAASVVRGILTGLMRASGTRVPTHISSTAEDGFAWLAPKLPPIAGRPVSPEDLRGAYDSFAMPVRSV